MLYGSFLPSFKLLRCDSYGQIALLILVVVVYRAEVLICTAYIKTFERGLIFHLQDVTWIEQIWLLAFVGHLELYYINVLFYVSGYNLPGSKFLTEISISYFRLGCLCNMVPVGKQGRKMCDMPMSYSKKNNRKVGHCFCGECAQLLLDHIETGSIQAVSFITLSWQQGIGDMERIDLIRGFHGNTLQ